MFLYQLLEAPGHSVKVKSVTTHSFGDFVALYSRESENTAIKSLYKTESMCPCSFSILGMHIFGCKFSLKTDTGDTVPDRKNFDSLLWAIVTVFQVLRPLVQAATGQFFSLKTLCTCLDTVSQAYPHLYT